MLFLSTAGSDKCNTPNGAILTTLASVSSSMSSQMSKFRLGRVSRRTRKIIAVRRHHVLRRGEVTPLFLSNVKETHGIPAKSSGLFNKRKRRGILVPTLEKRRIRGEGPKHVKISDGNLTRDDAAKGQPMLLHSFPETTST